nr:PREDICTED: probable LRR receptor-like serine/threonine-protein kinase At3g47570 [Daucus carota subsp. sativus]
MVEAAEAFRVPVARIESRCYLSVANNSFEAGFPTDLSNCVGLKYISMYGNDLEGKLPSEFASWSQLVTLHLGNNHFTGPIPSSIGNISSLRVLDLSSNNLVGGIPLEIAHHNKLEDLKLGLNNLEGMVPGPLYNISSLHTIDISSNKLAGTLPADLCLTLPELRGFSAGGNRFSGPLPSSLANASSLVKFSVWGNHITGPVLVNFRCLSHLENLNLGRNPLGDAQKDLTFFDSLVNCTHLRRLALDQTGIRGELPNSITNLSTTLEVLDLRGNQIYGIIPREIGKLLSLTLLILEHNLLTGSVPESVGYLSKLNILILGGNNISGLIPTSISNCTQLLDLSLENNRLRGSMPTELFNMSSLQILSLSNNKLEGVVPEQVRGLSPQCISLLLDRNLLTGPLPSNIGSLRHLNHLSVANNKLTGHIPATLGDCVMLEVLYMEGNLFEGKIPSSFEALKSLRFLDLSSNNLSENIPIFFEGFPLLEFLNLSNNKLEGEVPRERLFSNISAFSAVGNEGLCGGIRSLHLPACQVKESRNKRKTFLLIVILLVLVPLGILLACLVFTFCRRPKSKQLDDPATILHDNQYLRLSYQDLLLATDNFSPNNLLGKGRYGSVYKGVLKSSEQIVAVKVLDVELHGANKSFLAECETLRNIRHRNIIKIITACSSTDYKGNEFKALVFEFMANGSLDNWLHPSPCSYQGKDRNLTLLQRLNISIDVALGIDHLHHHSHGSIIHSDIKPSNILLDGEFVARVGDFGLAKFFLDTENHISRTQTNFTSVHGTVGYVPPEYGMCAEMSAEGDVYSYGIFLLEMFSGKRPTDIILMDSGNNLHDYVRKALPDRVMDIVDPRILLDQEYRSFTVNHSRATMEECLASIFEVGILCSEETPRKRIDMSVAVKQLHAARDKLLCCKRQSL